MSTALNRQKTSNETLEYQTQYDEKYQAYTEITLQQQLEHVFFFARVGALSVSTVLISFIFLAQNLPTFLAFGLALGISLGIVYSLSRGVQHLLNERD